MVDTAACNRLYWGDGLGGKLGVVATIEAMAAGGATAEQILGYDHTAGWQEVA